MTDPLLEALHRTRAGNLIRWIEDTSPTTHRHHVALRCHDHWSTSNGPIGGTLSTAELHRELTNALTAGLIRDLQTTTGWDHLPQP